MTAQDLRDRLTSVKRMADRHSAISIESRDVATALAFSYIAELAEIIGEAVREGVTTT